MKIKIENVQDNTARVFESPFTLLQFVKIHFCAFGGIYGVEKISANKYAIFDGFDGCQIYTVCKAGARDALTE